MMTLALSELLGATVYDPSGASGRVREVTLTPQEDRSRISGLIVKTKSGSRILSLAAVSAINGGIRTTMPASEWPAANGTEGLFLLERDLLDQQVIDINGRKVVRVNRRPWRRAATAARRSAQDGAACSAG
jgi:sporulation protein YlmC with PRC-barrel domain